MKRGLLQYTSQCSLRVLTVEADLSGQLNRLVAISLIRELELPLVITFNRGRMLLPPSISKSCGLRQLMETLGVSVDNAIGIGDAENDHELLASCEHGVAVSWGSARLKQFADEVIQGEGLEAVAEYIELDGYTLDRNAVLRP